MRQQQMMQFRICWKWDGSENYGWMLYLRFGTKLTQMKVEVWFYWKSNNLSLLQINCLHGRYLKSCRRMTTGKMGWTPIKSPARQNKWAAGHFCMFSILIAVLKRISWWIASRILFSPLWGRFSASPVHHGCVIKSSGLQWPDQGNCADKFAVLICLRRHRGALWHAATEDSQRSG